MATTYLAHPEFAPGSGAPPEAYHGGAPAGAPAVVAHQHHLAEQAAHHPLAIGHGRFWCCPERPYISDQPTEGSLLFGGQGGEATVLFTSILGLEIGDHAQLFVPTTLQLTGNQPILRFAQVVLAEGPLGSIPSPLQTQLPLARHGRTISLD